MSVVVIGGHFMSLSSISAISAVAPSTIVVSWSLFLKDCYDGGRRIRMRRWRWEMGAGAVGELNDILLWDIEANVDD